MKEKTLFGVGVSVRRNDLMFVKGKAKKKAVKLTNYVKGIVTYSVNKCFVNKVESYKNKLPKIYLIIGVYSYKSSGGKYTSISFRAMKGYKNITDDIKNNLLTISKGNDGSCTWSIRFYVKANNMKYTRDELVKKALKYAKKRGAKIYKNHLNII